jgi:hypothetical protein
LTLAVLEIKLQIVQDREATKMTPPAGSKPPKDRCNFAPSDGGLLEHMLLSESGTAGRESDCP